MILPRLEPAKCTGCGACVSVCPTQCLAMRGPLPWLPWPVDCVACDLCELICPTAAIVLVTANPTGELAVYAVESSASASKMPVPKA